MHHPSTFTEHPSDSIFAEDNVRYQCSDVATTSRRQRDDVLCGIRVQHGGPGKHTHAVVRVGILNSQADMRRKAKLT